MFQKIFVIVCVILPLSLCFTYQKCRSTPVELSMTQNDGLNNLKKTLMKVSKIALPALLGGAILFSQPEESSAASSGGRSGGSSFRSSPSRSSYSSPRSSTRLSSSYSYGVTPVMPIMPMVSPFGYGFGYGFSPFSIVSPNLLLLGGLAYIAYTVLSNRVGGSDFSNENEAGSLGSGATVVKLQLSLDADWSEKGNIMETLGNIAAKRGSVNGRSEISALLSEASIALLRRQSDWNSANLEGDSFNERSASRVEPLFQNIAVNERVKFEKETNGIASIRNNNMDVSGPKPTQAVVSLIVAIRGKSSALVKNARSLPSIKQCLQSLASEALTDEGDNIMAVEVLWTPSEPGSVLSEREIIQDYPELIKF
eukprot:gene9593-12920_t